MQSKAATVDAYIDELPPERRVAVAPLRRLCREVLKGYQEAMGYGMPCFKKGGVIEIGFASRKGYVALYCMKKGVVDAHRYRLKGLSVGKGCIRFPKPDEIDFAVVKRLPQATLRSPGFAC